MQRRSFLTILISFFASVKAFSFSKLFKEEKNMKAIPEKFPLALHWPTQDPFLFCAHHRDIYPKSDGELGVSTSLAGRNIGSDFEEKDGFRMYHGTRVPGFPRHPHKGFETITLIQEGFIDHADSLGRGGRYTKGDCQWMTAGAGIQHSEMFPLVYTDKENPLELMQIWINLPKAKKNATPGYIIYPDEKVTTIKPNEKVQVRLYAGQFGNAKALAAPSESWASDEKNEVGVWLIEIEDGGSLEIPKANDKMTKRSLYFYRGNKIQIANESITAKTGMFLNSEESMRVEAQGAKAYLLLLQGKSIGEPVAQYGPFVMNTRAELAQAFEEFQKTEFGKWPWGDSAATHGKEAKRFDKSINKTT